MSRISTITIVFLSCWLCAGKLQAVSPDVEKARRHGAEGQVTFQATDSTGKPVEKAQMRATFPHSDAYGDVEVSKGATDTNGIFIANGKTKDSVIYDIKKEAYYTTRGVYWFYRKGENCVQDGRWQPWNPTNTVVLKEHRNPVPMYAKRVDATIPVKDKPIGFDLEKGDWVAPYGQGIRADLVIRYTADYKGPQIFSKQMEITFSNEKDGLQALDLDKSSELMSSYMAPENGYIPNLMLERERTRHEIIKSKEMSKDQYVVFRVRTVTDKEGNIVKAYYGKIYRPIEYGLMAEKDRLMFTYYFNPDETRNLEFDPKQNLFRWKHDAPENVYEP